MTAQPDGLSPRHWSGLGQRLGGHHWPGLSRLYEDRDLVPANDVRQLFAQGLTNAWGLDRQAVLSRVFTA